MKKRILALMLSAVMICSSAVNAFATGEVVTQPEQEVAPASEEAEEVSVCDICQQENCAADHVYCDTCEKYDCGVDHSVTVCEICRQENCAVEHVYCETCEKYDCGVDHSVTVCEICQKESCAADHVYCETCEKYDCGVEHDAQPATEEEPKNLLQTSEFSCELCEGEDSHEVGCPLTFVEVNKPAAFVGLPVSLYLNPITKPENYKEFDESDLPETFTVQWSFPGYDGATWYILDTENWEEFADTDKPYSYVKSTDVTFDLDTEQTLADESTGIEVTGSLPVGSTIEVVEASAVPNAIIGVDHYDSSYTITQFGYDISLNNDGEPIQPDGSVTVCIPNAWDTSLDFPIVDVYHILDDEDAIAAAQDNGTLMTTSDAAMVAAYADEAAIARNALGLADTDVDVVAYVLFSTRCNNVTLTEDGGIEFQTDSFSLYYIVSGETNVGNITSTSTIYITPGTSGTFRIQNTNVTITQTDTFDANVTIEKGAISDEGKDRYTTFNVSADASASIGDQSVYELSWTQHTHDAESTSTIQVTVVVVSEVDKTKIDYLSNTVNHLQIDIASKAVALGYNEDSSFDLNLGFTTDTEYELTKVEDDSQVGFYYVLTYKYKDSNNVEIPVTVTVRIDELATKLPEGVTFAEVGQQWFVNKVVSQESQVTFGSRTDSTQAQFPVGTADYLIYYSITIDTNVKIAKNDTDPDDNVNPTPEEVKISVSAKIDYWSDSNECPGASDNIGGQAGMDLGDFTSGSVLGDTTYYVLFSNLTKVVSGYTFGENESKNYVFTIYRDLAVDDANTDKNEADLEEWVAFDTISITANGATTSTNFTTDATKYSVEDIDKYKYKIVETGYTISGYSCTNQIAVKGDGGSFVDSATGKFTFSSTTSADGKTVTYSAEIKCTNTYTEAGLTVKKVVENAPASAVETDVFTVKVWPKELSTTGIESDTNMFTYFNTGTYKVGGVAVNVTNNTSTTEYGYITLTIQGGQSLTITGLPAGTYYVQEIAGDNTNYEYDTNKYPADLSSGNAEVTITNTYKLCDLTITKTVDTNDISDYDEGQSFIFHVTGPNGFSLDVVINGTGSVTIKDLPFGEYTVTEDTTWSWRYTPVNSDDSKEITQKITLEANKANIVTFENKRTNSQWLSGDSYCENWFSTDEIKKRNGKNEIIND